MKQRSPAQFESCTIAKSAWTEPPDVTLGADDGTVFVAAFAIAADRLMGTTAA